MRVRLENIRFIGGILLKIPTSNSTKFHYNRYKFDIDVSIIKNTVPEEPSTFCAVSRLPLEGCPWQFTLDISDASCGKFQHY